MRVIAVDDEEMALTYLERLLHHMEPESEFWGFTEPEDAFAHLSGNSADVALLDIELGESNGLDLAQRCKELCPQINIIFVTGYPQYMLDAFKLRASGYLMKPIRADDLRAELDNLRNPITPRHVHRVRIQTFGNFECFVDGHPLKLPLAKCRECLAYLVDRKGALVTVAELAGILWEDKPLSRAVRNSTHQVISNLMKALRAVGAEDIIIRHPRELGIDPSRLDCDYYQVLSGDVRQLKGFTGEYMNNYSWAEFTVGELSTMKTST